MQNLSCNLVNGVILLALSSPLTLDYTALLSGRENDKRADYSF